MASRSTKIRPEIGALKCDACNSTIIVDSEQGYIAVDLVKLLEVSEVTPKEFNAFTLQLYQFDAEYAKRNRKEHVLQKILRKKPTERVKERF